MMAILAPLPAELTRAGFKRLPNKALRDHLAWSDDLAVARDVCAELGLQLSLTDADYQVAKITGEGVRLVIYPHKTTAGHRHLRVRNENSTNPARAAEAMVALDKAKTGWCTFSSNLRRLPQVTS